MLKDKLIQLLKVKSIITILTFGVFCYLSIIGKVDAQQFMLVLSMVATYYFAKKDNKEGA
jgi:thioredoxin-related protein